MDGWSLIWGRLRGSTDVEGLFLHLTMTTFSSFCGGSGAKWGLVVGGRCEGGRFLSRHRPFLSTFNVIAFKVAGQLGLNF